MGTPAAWAVGKALRMRGVGRGEHAAPFTEGSLQGDQIEKLEPGAGVEPATY
jgi:hypothetical protein